MIAQSKTAPDLAEITKPRRGLAGEHMLASALPLGSNPEPCPERTTERIAHPV